jgi:hypothetical protein
MGQTRGWRMSYSPTIGTLIGVTDANPLPESCLKPSQPDDDPKTKIKIAMINARSSVLVAAVTGAFTLTAAGFGWPHGLLSDTKASTATPGPTMSAVPSQSIAAMIASPTDGEEVVRCTPIRGVIPPPHGNVAYWLVISGGRGPANYRLTKGPITATAASDKPLIRWGVKPGIGAPEDTGATFRLLLVRTDNEAATRNFTDRSVLGDNSLGPELPPDTHVEDRITVRRVDGSGC